MVKSNISRLILVVFDALVVFVSVTLAYYLRVWLDPWFSSHLSSGLVHYASKLHIYAIILIAFYYEGIYTKRYDFWHESRQVLKALFFSFLVVFGLIALFKVSGQYSRMIIFFAFFFMAILIPLTKNILKKRLYKLGLWQRGAKIYGDDTFVEKEIFQNHYLGYVKAGDDAQTVFINSKSLGDTPLAEAIDTQMQKSQEVVFIPLLNEYDMTRSYIYGLSNVRTNLIVLTNRLKSKSRRAFRQVFNYLFAILLLPVLLPIIAVLAYLIKKESSGPVFFAHNRIGQDGKIIPTWKFRSMYSDAAERLEKLLAEDESIKKEWEATFKLKNDPRVTKIGRFLRKTSLDELPQIFNVLRGEMYFVGPRPVIQKELDLYYKDAAEYYLMVKPGITGLWQVSGRSDTDYDFRVAVDKWYVTNWSVWLDITILLKTIKVVLFRDGAY